MRSLIILEVEHGEDTDRLEKMIGHIQAEYHQSMTVYYPGRPYVTDHHFLIDIGENAEVRVETA